MKTKQQCEEKLEEVLATFSKLAETIGEDTKPEQVSEETRAKIIVNFGMLGCLAWILDVEEELRPLLTALRATTLAEKFKGLST